MAIMLSAYAVFFSFAYRDLTAATGALLLFGAVLWYSAGIPTTTTARLASMGGGLWLGVPIPVYIAVAATALCPGSR